MPVPGNPDTQPPGTPQRDTRPRRPQAPPPYLSNIPAQNETQRMPGAPSAGGAHERSGNQFLAGRAKAPARRSESRRR